MPNSELKTLDQFKTELLAELKAEVRGLANQLASLERRMKALEEKSGSGELKDLSQIKRELEAYTRRMVKIHMTSIAKESKQKSKQAEIVVSKPSQTPVEERKEEPERVSIFDIILPNPPRRRE